MTNIILISSELLNSLVSAVLKDVPNSPLELLKSPEMDAVRMGLFPSLDYKGLYNSLIPLIEVAPLIQYGLHGNAFQNNIILYLTLFVFSVWTSDFTVLRVPFTFSRT